MEPTLGWRYVRRIKVKLEEIENEIKTCTRCSLAKTRKNPVPGEGDVEAGIMLIGLGPGYHENLEGRPFVGAAGKFLNELLALAGLERGMVYITNVIKCYLPDNTPTEDQITTCGAYLDRQIECIKPKVIFTLGSIATSYIFQKFGLKLQSMGKIHGEIFQISNLLLQVKVISMYHPAAALYNPKMKETLRKDWEKLKILHLVERSR
jgi:uracil-DNA glycosylase family 4